MRRVRFRRHSSRRHSRVVVGIAAAFCLVATLAAPASASLIPRPADAAAKDRPGPLPVTGPDTIPIAGADGYITYGASTNAPRSVCGKPKAMGSAKHPKNCWVPYVVHGKGSKVGYAEQVTGDALRGGPGRWVNRNLGIWAPSVVHYRGKYYMFYTASQKGTAADPQERGRKCIGVATSTSARGSFRARSTPMFCRKGGWAIDAEAFVGRSNGNLYVTFRDDAATSGRETAISVVRLDTSVRKVVKRKRLLTSKAISWEGNTRQGTHIIENPSMIRAGDGTWWLFYSGNSWQTKKYATGIAKCGKDPISSCRPFPGKDRPYFGYVGDGGLSGPHKPIAKLPRNQKAPGGMSVFRARGHGGMRAVWNYKTFTKHSRRYSLVGRLQLKGGRWSVVPE